MSIMRAQLPRELHAYGEMAGNRQSLDAGAPSITYEGNQQAGGIYNQGSDRANAMMMWNQMSSGDKSIYDFNFEMFLDSGDWMDSILGQITGGQEDMMVQIKEAYKQHKAQGGQESFEEFIQIIGEQGQGRQQAAYGGIMGVDGRRQYGIGSWFQKKVMDPIKGTVKKAIDNPLLTAAAVGTLANYKDIIPGDRDSTGWFGNLMEKITGPGREYTMEDVYNEEGDEVIGQKKVYKDSKDSGGWFSTARDAIGSGITSALSNPEFLIPAAGLIGGAFAKEDEPGYTGQGTGLNLRDIGRIANITDEKQGQAAGLRFLPQASARKYTPEEMIATYAATDPANFETPATAAQGGRIGYSIGGITEEQDAMIRDMLNRKMDIETISTMGGVTPEQIQIIIDQINEGKKGLEESGALEDIMNLKAQGGRIGYNEGGLTTYEISSLKGLGYDTKGGTVLKPFGGLKVLRDILKVNNMAQGGRIGAQQGGLMSLGGMEMDLRGGGFVPIGEREKADDVPARLSKNEFVFTADAVRAAGGGDVDAGADKMYRTMKDLEGMVA